LVIAEATVKLLLTVLFVRAGLQQWVYAAIPLSMTVSFQFGLVAGKQIIHQSDKKYEDPKSKFEYFPKSFFWFIYTYRAFSVAFLGLDVF